MHEHGQGRRVETGFGSVHVETEGEGPPVILVPGGPGTGHAHYHPWFSRLADGHTVVYYDALGTGRSDRLDDPGGYTLQTYAATVEAIRRQLGADSVMLVGLSFGGLTALEYAVRNPERVHRIVASNARTAPSRGSGGTSTTSTTSFGSGTRNGGSSCCGCGPRAYGRWPRRTRTCSNRSCPGWNGPIRTGDRS